MAIFDEFLDALRENLRELVREQWREHRDAALADGASFVERTRADLERWVGLLASGDLTADDFEWLVQGKKDLAELEALKQKGLAKARLDRFRTALVDVVVRSAVGVV